MGNNRQHEHGRELPWYALKSELSFNVQKVCSLDATLCNNNGWQYNGIVEVVGSIPIASTKFSRSLSLLHSLILQFTSSHFLRFHRFLRVFRHRKCANAHWSTYRLMCSLGLAFLITLSAGCAHSLTNKTSTVQPALRAVGKTRLGRVGNRAVVGGGATVTTPFKYHYSFLIAEFESPEPRDVCLSDSVKSRRVCLETDRPWRANTRASTNLRKLTENPRGNTSQTSSRLDSVKHSDGASNGKHR